MNKIEQLKALAGLDLSALVELAKMFGDMPAKEERRPVLVRTYSAGVHFGTLESREGKEVVLTEARRVWCWKGANTLHELCVNGPGEGSKISEPTARITLTEAIEIIDLTSDQHDRLARKAWGK